MVFNNNGILLIGQMVFLSGARRFGKTSAHDCTGVVDDQYHTFFTLTGGKKSRDAGTT